MEGRVQYRYSNAFKRKVIKEIEAGKYTAGEAARVYGIGGKTTLYNWLRSFGKNRLIGKVVKVQMKDEVDKMKTLENRIRLLEKALADKEIEAVAWKSLLEVAEEHYGEDFKKNSIPKLSHEQKALLRQILKDSARSMDTPDRDITSG